jgi:hypothetical protein
MKKVVALLLVVAISNSCFAQEEQKESKIQPIQFGFSMGVNYSNVIIPMSPIPNGGSLENGLGFQMGILMDAPLSHRVSIVPRAELTFRAGQINFEDDPGQIESIGVMSTTIDAIAHFNFKISDKPLSPYIVVGPAFSYELSDADPKSPTDFPSSPNLAIDMGFGFNKTMTHFGLAPELRYSFGMFNVNNNPVMTSVYAHSVTLAVSFKG